jgi:hypothetical protein
MAKQSESRIHPHHPTGISNISLGVFPSSSTRSMMLLWLLFQIIPITARLSSPGIIEENHTHGHIHHNHWVPMQSSFLEKVYTSYDACILRQQGNCLPPSNELEKKCSGFYPKDVEARNNYLSDTSISFPRSLYEIPASYSEEHNFSQLIRITDLLVSLNASNTTLALWGDSVTRDSILSLICIVGIENMFDVILDPPNIMTSGGDFIFQKLNIIFLHPTTKQSITTRVFFYQEKGTRNKDLSALKLLTAISKDAPNSHFLFVLNCGLHFDGYSHMAKRLESLLSFAKQHLLPLGNMSSTNKILYRETSTQHFNHSSGYYDATISPSTIKDDTNYSSFMCVPSQRTSNYSYDYRHHAERDVLLQMKVKDTDIIHFRDLSTVISTLHRFFSYAQTAAAVITTIPARKVYDITAKIALIFHTFLI